MLLRTPLKESRKSLHLCIYFILIFLIFFFYETRLGAYPVYMRTCGGVAVHLSC